MDLRKNQLFQDAMWGVKTTISIIVWLLIIVFLALWHGKIVGAWEIHRGAGKTVDGKMRISSMPYTHDIAEGNMADHAVWVCAGHNPDVGTALETVWPPSVGNPFITGATTVRLSSSATGDSGVTATVYALDANLALGTYTVTLNGQTPVTLAGVSPYRVLRIDNDSSTAWAGDVYAAGIDATYAGGVPQQSSLILGKVLIGWGRTGNGFFTIPAGKHGYITNWYASTSSAKLTEIVLMIRPYGQTWKVMRNQHINQNSFDREFAFPEPLTPKCDVQIKALVTVAGGDVSAGFSLWYED